MSRKTRIRISRRPNTRAIRTFDGDYSLEPLIVSLSPESRDHLVRSGWR